MRTSAPSSTAASRRLRVLSEPAGAGLTVLLLFVASFGVVLATTTTAGLNQRQTLSLFIALHGLSALMSLGLTLRYQQPMMATYSFAGFLLAMDAVGQYGYAATAGSVLVTGLVLILVAMSFNLVGDGLRDALDPKLRK